MKFHRQHVSQLSAKLKLNDQRGFTFIELLVLAILGAALITNVTPDIINSGCFEPGYKPPNLFDTCLKELRIDPTFRAAQDPNQAGEAKPEELDMLAKWVPSVIEQTLTEIYSSEKYLTQKVNLARYDPPTFRLTVGDEAGIGEFKEIPKVAVRVPAFVEVKRVAKALSDTYGGQITESTKDILAEVVTFPVDFDTYSLSGSVVALDSPGNKMYRISVQLTNPELRLLKPLVRCTFQVTVPEDHWVTRYLPCDPWGKETFLSLTADYDPEEGSRPIEELAFRIAQKINHMRGVKLLDHLSLYGFRKMKKGFKELVDHEQGIEHLTDDAYKEVHDAEKAFAHAIQDQNHPLPWIGLAITQYQLGDYTRAITNFKKAKALLESGEMRIKNSPDLVEEQNTISPYLAAYGLGITYHRLNDYDSAGSYLEEAQAGYELTRQSNPDSPTSSPGIFIQQALLATDQDNMQRAEDRFRDAVTHSQEDEAPNIQLAEFLMARAYLDSAKTSGFCKEALEEYKKAYKKKPSPIILSLVSGLPCNDNSDIKSFSQDIEAELKLNGQISGAKLVESTELKTLLNFDLKKLRTGADAKVGHFIAKIVKEQTGADIVILAAGAIRPVRDIENLSIQDQHIRRLLPFQDILVSMDMTEEEIKDGLKLDMTEKKVQDGLKYILFHGNKNVFERGRLPMTAGIKTEIKTCLTTGKFQVLESKFELDGSSAPKNGKYKVVTLKYNSNGHDGYQAFTPFGGTRHERPVKLETVKSLNHNLSLTDTVKLWIEENRKEIDKNVQQVLASLTLPQVSPCP